MARTAAVATSTLALLLLALAACVPPVAAKEPGLYNPDAPSPVKLYMHLIDVQDFPINTQLPDDKWTQDTTYGLTTSTVTCTPPDPTGSVNVREPFHTFYGYSSPSYVEYRQEENGKPQVHPERGISYDANIDTATPFTVYFYASVKGALADSGDLPSTDQVPLPVPNVVLQATMRTGTEVSINDRAYNTGDVIAQGRTIPATLVADQVMGAPGGADPAPTTKALGQHDGKWLYEFAIPMTVELPVIPRATGYNLRVDLFMDNPACTQGNDNTLLPNVLALHSSKDRRPRLELAITNPVRVTTLHPQFVGDDLVVHAGANAAWGNYDLAEPNALYTPELGDTGVQLTIEGPTPATSVALANVVSDWDPHYQHQEDVTLAYVWPYKADRAVPGVYTVVLRVTNDQQTAVAEAVSQFEIGKNTAVECTEKGCNPTEPTGTPGGKGAPGVGLVAALAAVGLAAVAVRRRR